MVGASRGLGRGIAVAFAEAGAPVVARHRPQVLVVAAGAVPHTSPLQHQTWETFSTNWHADVRIAFTWLRQVLPQPMSPGSRIVVASSGAAINSSPISAGYAGAKATQRFIVSYAQDEADRAGLGITITTLMPRTTPLGDVGLSGVRAYSARSAQTEEMFVDQLGPLLTPEIAGSAVVELILSDPTTMAAGYVLTAAGLQAVP